MEGAAAPAPRPGVIVSRGEPVKADFSLRTENGDTGGGAQETPEQKLARETQEAAEKNKPPTLTPEQEKAFLMEKLGLTDFDGNIDALKEKLKPTPQTPPAPTPEEIKKKEEAFDKRMLDHYIESGGTAEEFVALKKIATAENLKDVSIATIKSEMKDAGFDDSEIDIVLKERYYQISLDELKQGADEEDADFEKRKVALQKKISYGSKKLENRSSYIKKNAADALSNIKSAIEKKDAEAAKELELSSKVEEHLSKIPRKLTFEMGEINGNKIDPVTYEVSDADIAEVAATLKDPAKRKQFLFTQDNGLNIQNVAEVMLRNKYLETALKAAYLEGGNRQVAAFRKVFPNDPAALGIGGQKNNTGGRKGHIVSAGKPEPMPVTVK